MLQALIGFREEAVGSLQLAQCHKSSLWSLTYTVSSFVKFAVMIMRTLEIGRLKISQAKKLQTRLVNDLIDLQ